MPPEDEYQQYFSDDVVLPPIDPNNPNFQTPYTNENPLFPPNVPETFANQYPAYSDDYNEFDQNSYPYPYPQFPYYNPFSNPPQQPSSSSSSTSTSSSGTAMPAS